jgi:hypothetical protein
MLTSLASQTQEDPGAIERQVQGTVCARRETLSCRYCPGSVDLPVECPTIVQVLGVSRNLQNIARCFVHFPTRKLGSCRDGRCDFFYAWYRRRLASDSPVTRYRPDRSPSCICCRVQNKCCLHDKALRSVADRLSGWRRLAAGWIVDL